jgi:hypothetical protein
MDTRNERASLGFGVYGWADWTAQLNGITRSPFVATLGASIAMIPRRAIS